MTYPTITSGGLTIDTNQQWIINLFNEAYFRTQLSTQQAASLDNLIAAGTYANAYHYWAAIGIKAGISPCKYYNEAVYLSLNPDIKARVKGESLNQSTASNLFDSGLVHWLVAGVSEIINGNRSSAASQASYPLSTGLDIFTGDSDVGAVFTATDATLTSGDNLNGINAASSVLSVTIGGAPASAITVSNIGTVNVSASSAQTFDMTSYTGITNLNFKNSSQATIISNLSLNPTIGLTNIATGGTIGYIAGALSDNLSALNIVANNVTAGTYTLNNSAHGYKTINIASNGSTTNVIALAGTAFTTSQSSVLNITGSEQITLSLAAGLTGIRTITASPVAKVTLADLTTGTTSNLLTTSTLFSAPGSTLVLAGTQTLALGNTIGFTGAGNTLYVTKNTALAAVANTGSLFTNLQTLGISTGLTAGTVNASYFGSNIRTVNLDATLGGNASVIGLANGSTINIGLATAAVIATTNTLTLSPASGSSNAVSVNLLGNAGATVTDTITLTNGFITANVNVSSSATSGIQTLALGGSAASLTTINLTGGAAGGTVTPTLGGNSITVNAQNLVSALTMTSGSAGLTTINGPTNAISTLTTGAAENIFNTGVLADVFSITGNSATKGYTTITGHSGDVVANTYKFLTCGLAASGSSDAQIAPVVITDFNNGAATSAVDVIQFSVGTLPATVNAYMLGTGNTSPTAATGVVQAVTAAGTVTLGNTTSVVVYSYANVASAAAMQTIVQAAGTKWIFGNAVVTATLNAMPIVYSDGTNVHLALLEMVTTGQVDTNAGNAVVKDIALLANTTAALDLIGNFDSSDFAYIA